MVMTELSPFVRLKWQEIKGEARGTGADAASFRLQRELGQENAKVGAATQQTA
jgi:hypothetical protein